MSDGRTERPDLLLTGALPDVTTLGPPGNALWTAGCTLACRGCMSPDTWPRRFGRWAAPSDVAGWLHASNIRFLTVSGGEPTDQCVALNALLDLLCPDWTITLYSGYDLEELQARRSRDIDDLLGRIDLLIAGRYEVEAHDSLSWRGSRNQQIHALSGRIHPPEEDTTAGVQVMRTATDLTVVGVPPKPGVFAMVRASGAERGLSIPLRPASAAAFPFPTRPYYDVQE
jgi:anaerobic ribonucleoside-triphosphate reductase activating protein